MTARDARIAVNQSYVTQRVTGQQRYAHEIASRLLPRPGVVALEPTGWWRGSSARVWAWALSVLPSPSPPAHPSGRAGTCSWCTTSSS
jgi:hypothetical protein